MKTNPNTSILRHRETFVKQGKGLRVFSHQLSGALTLNVPFCPGSALCISHRPKKKFKLYRKSSSGLCVLPSLYFRPRGLCDVEAAFSITETTIMSFSSFSIMKEMEKEKDRIGRPSKKETEVKRGEKEKRGKRRTVFQVSPFVFFGLSVCLIASLIGSIWGRRRTWLGM